MTKMDQTLELLCATLCPSLVPEKSDQKNHEVKRRQFLMIDFTHQQAVRQAGGGRLPLLPGEAQLFTDPTEGKLFALWPG